MKRLASLLLIALASVANAQTTVPFTGTVSTACSLSVIQNGVLAVRTTQPTTMSTSSPGQKASVSVSFIGTPTVTILMPSSFTSSPTLPFTPVFSGSISSTSEGSLTISSGQASATYSGGSGDYIEIGLQISSGGMEPFPTGSYAAEAMVTCS